MAKLIKIVTHYNNVQKFEEMVNKVSSQLQYDTRGVSGIEIIATNTDKGIKYDAFILYQE